MQRDCRFLDVVIHQCVQAVYGKPVYNSKFEVDWALNPTCQRAGRSCFCQLKFTNVKQWCAPGPVSSSTERRETRRRRGFR